MSLIIHEENRKENHNLIMSLNVIKTRLLFSSNFCGLENTNFQTFCTNQRVKGLVFRAI